MHLNVPDSPNNSAKDIIQLAIQRNELHHAGLMFYRYLNGTDSKQHFRQLQGLIDRTQFPTLKDHHKRIQALLREWTTCGQDFAQTCFEGKLIGRLAPGLGITSVFENGISLHHIHGFPYIPGSSLKGIAQDYSREVEGTAANSREFIAVFGKQTPRERTEEFEAQQGKAIFLDAFPTEGKTEGRALLTLDVMTPHYTKYYEHKGKEPPADYLDPNPIVFLTVKDGVRFLFCLRAKALKDKDGNTSMDAEDVLSHAQKWLQGGLSTLGVGAKTALGYGYFQDFCPYSP